MRIPGQRLLTVLIIGLTPGVQYDVCLRTVDAVNLFEQPLQKLAIAAERAALEIKALEADFAKWQYIELLIDRPVFARVKRIDAQFLPDRYTTRNPGSGAELEAAERGRSHGGLRGRQTDQR